MNRIPDRKKLRREYLRLKCIGMLLKHGGLLLCFPLAFVAVLLGMVGLCIGAYGLLHMDPFMLIGVILIVLAAILGFLSYSAYYAVGFGDQVLNTTYVPPVTPDTLPVKEVLVRGAEEPAAASETLLRATVKSEATKAEELLAHSSGHDRRAGLMRVQGRRAAKMRRDPCSFWGNIPPG